MGHKSEKHKKKRFFCVKYVFKEDKKFDEFVELSKKKIGSGKMQEYTVVLDLINEEVLKCELPGIPVDMQDKVPYENVFKHYQKWYADVMAEFVKS
jgi:hypothetical protein|tara:strand:+ start:705 stop:992 length:288 start_codon:yes stop_codon:yes gene_type:complete